MKELIKIQNILKFALNNPYSDFYRKKYKTTGFKKSQFETIENFEKLPYLIREEIVTTDPYDRLFVPDKSLKGAYITKGTSKTGPLIVLRDWETIRVGKRVESLNHQPFFRDLRKSKARKILVLDPMLSYNRFMSSPFPDDLFVILGDITNLELSAVFASKVRIDAIYTSATALFFFAPYLAQKYDLLKIRNIQLSGDVCSNAKFNILNKIFPKARFRFCMAQSEAKGEIGWQCNNLAGKSSSVYHFWDTFYPEVLNPQTLSKALPGEAGEMVLTTLKKRSFILLRYRTGDKIKILTKKCSCKYKSALFEYLGRVDADFVSVMGASFYKSEFAKVLLKYKISDNAFCVEIRENVHGLSISYSTRVYIYLQINNNRKLSLARKIAGDLESGIKISPTLSYSEIAKKGFFSEIDVVFVEKSEEIRKNKTFQVIYKS